MAELVKKNEAVQLPLFKNGVTLQWFMIDFPAAITAKTSATTAGVPSPVAKALEAIAQVASIEVVGNPQTGNYGQGAGSMLRVAVAALGGNYGTDTYDGTNSETFAAHLEDLVQAVTYGGSGSIQSINMALTTVTNLTI
jgi:hypothetical protein